MLGIFANICARGLKKRSANRRSDVPSSKIRPPSKNPGDYEAFQVFQRVRPILSLIFQNHVVFFLIWSKPKERWERKKSCELPVIAMNYQYHQVQVECHSNVRWAKWSNISAHPKAFGSALRRQWRSINPWLWNCQTFFRPMDLSMFLRLDF